MGRRTRREKERVKYNFKVVSPSEAKKINIEANVKGQIEKQGYKTPSIVNKPKNAEFLVEEGYLGTVRKDILRSIFNASLILAIELVLYLVWR